MKKLPFSLDLEGKVVVVTGAGGVLCSGFAKTAADCVDCGVCETRCPYNLPIRKMLGKAKEIFGK